MIFPVQGPSPTLPSVTIHRAGPYRSVAGMILIRVHCVEKWKRTIQRMYFPAVRYYDAPNEPESEK